MLKPINGNVLVKKFEDNSISTNLIMSTDSASKFTRGIVVASDCDAVKKDSTVVFADFAVDKVDDMFIIHNSDIFAIDE